MKRLFMSITIVFVVISACPGKTLALFLAGPFGDADLKKPRRFFVRESSYNLTSIVHGDGQWLTILIKNTDVGGESPDRKTLSSMFSISPMIHGRKAKDLIRLFLPGYNGGYCLPWKTETNGRCNPHIVLKTAGFSDEKKSIS